MGDGKVPLNSPPHRPQTPLFRLEEASRASTRQGVLGSLFQVNAVVRGVVEEVCHALEVAGETRRF